ncbi:uncharacterized protein LOC110676885 [Aedes aegypti]|uniref:Uncharacterized protein n=1 Tax=Aedes aegypti TaxID=7159 RepID=A0A6I8TZT8_AEDAE|nr:uncharacterized protein LOC110676885 [Aedes aegypti]
MISTILPLFFVALVTAIDEQLLCYYCEDCSLSDPVIQPCGFAIPSETTPALTLPPNGDGGTNTLYPQYPSDGVQNPSLTTPTTPLWNNGGTNNGGVIITTLWPGMGSSQIVNGGGSNNGGVLTTIWPGMASSQLVNGGTINGGGLLTTVWPGQRMPAKRDNKPTHDNNYLCVTTQSTVGNHQVIGRGCARQGRSKIETCNEITKGNVQSCTLCSSPLCNNE